MLMIRKAGTPIESILFSALKNNKRGSAQVQNNTVPKTIMPNVIKRASFNTVFKRTLFSAP